MFNLIMVPLHIFAAVLLWYAVVKPSMSAKEKDKLFFYSYSFFVVVNIGLAIYNVFMVIKQINS